MLFGSTILETAIGLILVYLVVSLICSAVQELIAQIFRLRARTLLAGVETMLTPKLVDELYRHPLIDTQYRGSSENKRTQLRPTGPSYIGSDVFVMTLLDVLRKTKETGAAAIDAVGRLSISAPQAEPMAAGGRVDNGLHAYAVTFVFPAGETASGNTVTVTIVDSNKAGQVQLTGIPVGPDGVAQRKIYRSKAGTQAPLYLLATLADNTTSVYTDDTPDASLAAVQSPGPGTMAVSTVPPWLWDAINALPDLGPQDKNVKDLLTLLLNNAEGDYNRFKLSLAQWYDTTMDRVSGWYKKQAQWILLGIALVVTATFGVDTLAVATSLWTNPALRAQAVTVAQQTVSPTSGANAKQEAIRIDKLNTKLNALQLPIGWSNAPASSNYGGWAVKIAGLLLTILAASLGAPFWFDLLNKFVNIRAAGPPPETQAGSTAVGQTTDTERNAMLGLT